MKTVIALLVLTPFAFAQSDSATAAAAGCGPTNVQFEVKTDNRHPATRPDSGKAVVYFIQDDTRYLAHPRPTTRMAIDGTWVGATHANSYFYLTVEPGEHHLCASWQSSRGFVGHTAAAVHFSAVAGTTYYFVVRNSIRTNRPADIKIIPVDDAEGQLLASEFSFATSHPK